MSCKFQPVNPTPSGSASIFCTSIFPNGNILMTRKIKRGIFLQLKSTIKEIEGYAPDFQTYAPVISVFVIQKINQKQYTTCKRL